jgi:GT2 family glycosyltransferase
MDVSVVVPTCGRPLLLRRCLAHLEAQTARARIAQVIVVEDGPRPETARVLDEVAAAGLVRLVAVPQEPARGPAAARNLGVAHAEAPVTVLLDADVLLAPDAIEQLCAAGLPAGDAACSLLGLVTWHPGEPIGPFMYWQEHGGAQFDYDGIATPENCGWRFYGTSFIATRTDLLRRVRFDEGFRIRRYEDMELGHRLERDHAHRIRFVPGAIGWQVHPVTLVEWLERVPGFAAPALRFAERAADPRVAQAIGIEAARQIRRFRWAALARAAELILELEPRVAIPPRATEVYGQLWEWECLATAYRVVQNFFHLSGLRDALALPPSLAVDAALDAGGACRRLLARLAGGEEEPRAAVG